MAVNLEISVFELKKLLDEKKRFLLLDCRTPVEEKIAKIAGSTLVPLNEIPQKMIEFDKGKEIIVYCHHSGRSSFAATFLARAGFKAKFLAGGIDAWAKKIDSSVALY
mgnify:CR=1 FL=1